MQVLDVIPHLSLHGCEARAPTPTVRGSVLTCVPRHQILQDHSILVCAVASSRCQVLTGVMHMLLWLLSRGVYLVLPAHYIALVVPRYASERYYTTTISWLRGETHTQVTFGSGVFHTFCWHHDHALGHHSRCVIVIHSRVIQHTMMRLYHRLARCSYRWRWLLDTAEALHERLSHWTNLHLNLGRLHFPEVCINLLLGLRFYINNFSLDIFLLYWSDCCDLGD